MGKGYKTLLIVVLFSFKIIGVFGDEYKEESHPYYEYIQIFKNIPALFEYLLDALEERPEILEKNDVTLFKRNIDVDIDENDNSGNERKKEKRDADCDNPEKQDEPNKNIGKTDTGHCKDVSESTVAYEYGNSNIMMNDFDERESNKVISQRTADYDVDKINKKETSKMKNSINRRNKRSVESLNDDALDDKLRDYGNAFFGLESSFGLDLNPEEIEERILTAEKMLEEYNTKKDK